MLLDDIIKSVTEGKEPVAQTLRRCLVLAYDLKNDTFKTWLEKELNGYESIEELPDYRKATGVAKGLFVGSFGRQISDQPIPPSALKDEHRHFARDIRLTQPIAAYSEKNSEKDAVLAWPADLVTLYQKTFFEGDMILFRAWMEIPGSVISGLIDIVRTRVLTFALEIKAQIPGGTESTVKSLSPAIVERMVSVTILGGNNVFGNVQEFNAPTVIAGDLNSLKAALKYIGVTEDEFAALETIIEGDAVTSTKSLGTKTQEWISQTAKKLGNAGLRIGGQIAEEAVKGLIKSYFGLP